ncbi:MAG TPA: DUF222 domain-containing protein [Actinotalea sp.]|nr:DUF222 domain-containing protein [Actinotalea sp.]
MTGGTPLEARRDHMAAAVEAVDGLGSELWRAGGADLEALMGEADRMVAAGEAARVLVLAEAMSRGETGASPLALTPVQWVRRHAPSTRGGGSAQIVAVAKVFSVPGREAVKDAVLSGALPVSSAAVVASEADKLAPLLAEGVEPTVVDGLITMAVSEGPRGCRTLRPRLLAEYGRDGQLQDEQDVAKRFVSLSQPRVDEMGMAEYRMTLDPEGRAVLEAALGPLSAPHPVDGERDLRSSDRRRGEALVTLVRRAVERGDQGPRHTKSQLFVTVDLETLRDGLRGAGTTMGGPEAGTLLAPETVRRLACDATIIPTLLGVGGAIVDLGRDVRLFTAAQTKRLWLRDRHCSYPGCDMPAQWTDAHHLIHWADGGPSDLSNAALLCERHHTIVHQRRYAGVVVTGDAGERVEWDLTVDSYDRLLAIEAAREPA